MNSRSHQFRTSFGPSDNALWLMFLGVLPCKTRGLATPETIRLEIRRQGGTLVLHWPLSAAQQRTLLLGTDCDDPN